MARLIDADEFIAEHCADCKYAKVNGICSKEVPMCRSVQIVTELPTIDAVEVVRCKDCKHWHEETGFCEKHSNFDVEEMEWDMFAEDDFCSYGERKEE